MVQLYHRCPLLVVTRQIANSGIDASQMMHIVNTAEVWHPCSCWWSCLGQSRSREFGCLNLAVAETALPDLVHSTRWVGRRSFCATVVPIGPIVYTSIQVSACKLGTRILEMEMTSLIQIYNITSRDVLYSVLRTNTPYSVFCASYMRPVRGPAS